MTTFICVGIMSFAILMLFETFCKYMNRKHPKPENYEEIMKQEKEVKVSVNDKELEDSEQQVYDMMEVVRKLVEQEVKVQTSYLNAKIEHFIVQEPQLKIKPIHPDAIIPKYQHEDDSCFDLHALHDTPIRAGTVVKVRTGLSFGIPKGYEIQVRARSGISANTKLRIANSVGSVDKNFTGEVLVLIEDITPVGIIGSETVIKKGERFAQAALCRVAHPKILVVDELEETERGSNGFGSTGR